MEDAEIEWEIQEHESEGNSGKRCWGVVNKGLSLGKKILVAGVVLSSAPLVLPPLVIISTIVFGFSVPSGLFLASYVCAEKLMDKLLPRTTTAPSLLGFGTWSDRKDVDGAKIEQDIDYEEEEELPRDVKGEVEGNFELSDKDNGEADFRKGSVGTYEKRFAEGPDEIVEENVNGGDVELLKEQDKPSEEMEVTITMTGEGSEDELVSEQVKDEQPVNFLSRVDVVIEGDDKSDRNVVEDGTSFDTKVAVESCRDGNIEEDKEVVREKRGLIEKLRDEGDSENVVLFDAANFVEEDDRPLEEKQTVLQAEKAVESSANNDNLVNGKGKILQYSKEDGREIADESEFDLLHEKHAPAQLSKKEAYNGAEEREGVDSAELPSTEREDLTNHVEKSSKNNTGMGSKEHYSDQEIWKQINALRIIVGRKVAPQATYVEELKVLYIFTGVEPPASLGEHSDLEEVNEKLQLLKSIVGVK